jgi:hypothetical protein
LDKALEAEAKAEALTGIEVFKPGPAGDAAHPFQAMAGVCKIATGESVGAKSIFAPAAEMP